MKRLKTNILRLAGMVLAATVPAALRAGVWHYSGPDGPAHWAALDRANSACSTGHEQSPIDLSGRMVHEGRDAVALDWHAGTFRLVNNGHTIEAEAPQGSRLTIDGEALPLRQLHFHLPSEHVRGGRHWAMEAHFVHQAATGGRTAVVAVMLVPGRPNASFHMLMARAPTRPGTARTMEFDPRALLPRRRSHFRYEGSLTTPPCSEVVDWEVIETPITVAAADIARFRTLIGQNARPLQPVGRRIILHVPG
jgi:carbonic anhydrase